MQSPFKQAAAALIVVGLGGCAPTTPHWETNFGNSLRSTLAAQVIDPAAVRNTNPVHGIDGKAAAGIVVQYNASYFKVTPPPASLTSDK